MRTDDLIEQLTADLRPVGRHAVERALALAAGAGLAAGLAGLALWLGFRPDLAQAVWTAPFWIKLGFTLAVAGAALMLSRRLAQPGGRGRGLWWAAAAPFALMIAAGALEIAPVPAPDRLRLWLGGSWSVCPVRILAISLPALVAMLWTFRRLAPTRLRLAGFAAGLAAGGVGACAYAFGCTETSATFLATWYSLGMLGVAGLGALVGPNILRW